MSNEDGIPLKEIAWPKITESTTMFSSGWGQTLMMMANRSFILTLAAGMTMGFSLAYILSVATFSDHYNVSSIASVFFRQSQYSDFNSYIK